MTVTTPRHAALVAMLVLACAAVFTPAPARAVAPSNKHALDPKRTGIPFETVTFRSTRDSVELNGWWFANKPGAPVVVVCPRGSGTMADLLPSVRELSTRGYAVMTFDYRDFGPGSVGEADTLRTLIFASRWVNDTEGALLFARKRAAGAPVFAWGQDLGSQTAVAAAARTRGNADAVACEGLFRTAQEQLRWNGTSSDPDAVRQHRMLVDGSDEPLSAVSMLQVPLFVVYAGKDDVTPPNVTRDLTRRSLSIIDRLTLPTAGHDGAELSPGYFDQLANWFRRIATALASTPH